MHAAWRRRHWPLRVASGPRGLTAEYAGTLAKVPAATPEKIAGMIDGELGRMVTPAVAVPAVAPVMAAAA